MAFITTTTTRCLPKRTRTSSTTAFAPPKAQLSRRQALLLPLPFLLPLLPRSARADHTYVAARRAYDRYHPRILSAIETIKQIRGHVLSNDCESANALIANKLFDIKARRAFSIYATSFSDNYLGERSRSMLKSVDGMFGELAFVGRGEDMGVHYGKAVQKLKDYYTEARLPASEIDGLGI